MPSELQRQVEAAVCQTKRRSGWPVRTNIEATGRVAGELLPVARRSAAGEGAARRSRHGQSRPTKRPMRRSARCGAYALKHPGIRHRELAWRMVDEGVACLSPSTVYRILKGENLVCPWRRRKKRTREEEEKAKRPDEMWASDLMYVQIAARTYFLLTFLDEYSRLIVHHALVPSMDGITVSVEAQAAIEQYLEERGGEIPVAGHAAAAERQRELLRLPGISRGLGRTSAWASADQAALSRGERDYRAE